MSRLVGIQQLRAAPSRRREEEPDKGSAPPPPERPSGPAALVAAQTVIARVRDILYPVILVTRGSGRGARRFVTWWRGNPGEKRTTVLFLVAGVTYLAVLLPWGPILLVGALGCVAALLGRDPRPAAAADAADAGTDDRLAAVYHGLVPYFMDEHDPEGPFRPGGRYPDAFTSWEFDGDGRVRRLELKYSRYFRDGDADTRRGVERALAAKLGRNAEYRCDWDEQGNRLTVTVLQPLPTGVTAQVWPVAGIEQVLGFTDDTGTPRRIPVRVDGAEQAMTPVIWRVGRSSEHAHLLVGGTPGSGRSNLLRTLAVQAAAGGGEVLLIDGRGDGTFHTLGGLADLTGVRVESTPKGVDEALRWAVAEAERRHAHLLRARHGLPGPDAAEADGAAEEEQSEDDPLARRRRLWVIVDDLAEACDAAASLGLADPASAVAALLRQGRLAHVTVAAALSSARIGDVAATLLPLAGTRVGLGRLDGPTFHTLFSTPLTVEGFGPMPPGRGYARIGAGEIVRLQVPVMPDTAAGTDTSGILPPAVHEDDADAVAVGKAPVEVG